MYICIFVYIVYMYICTLYITTVLYRPKTSRPDLQTCKRLEVQAGFVCQFKQFKLKSIMHNILYLYLYNCRKISSIQIYFGSPKFSYTIFCSIAPKHV